MILPSAVALTTMVKVADAEGTRLALVQVTVPVPPTGGVVGHVHPAAGVMDWNVVVAGSKSVKMGVLATFGPLFITMTV